MFIVCLRIFNSLLLSHRVLHMQKRKEEKNAAAWAFNMQSVLLPDEYPIQIDMYVHIVAMLTGPSLEYDQKEIQFSV